MLCVDFSIIIYNIENTWLLVFNGYAVTKLVEYVCIILISHQYYRLVSRNIWWNTFVLGDLATLGNQLITLECTVIVVTMRWGFILGASSTVNDIIIILYLGKTNFVIDYARVSISNRPDVRVMGQRIDLFK